MKKAWVKQTDPQCSMEDLMGHMKVLTVKPVGLESAVKPTEIEFIAQIF